MVTPASSSLLRVRGARQHNLQGVDVDLPRNALVVVTGVSGSGKSSLAFDTLFREGQRRFLETLSSYARQFLGDLRKPDVELIEGLSPAIAVDQKSVPRGSRSTVGTLTEVTDHLRILFARAGAAHCPSCDKPVQARTPEAVVQEILGAHDGDAVMLGAPVVRGRKGNHTAVLDDLRRRGFVRARVDGTVHRLEDVPELGRYKVHDIEVIVDRLRPDPEQVGRLRESVQQCLDLGDGDLLLVAGDEARLLSTQRTCPGCGGDVPPLEPRLFSFNSPVGACPACEGHGVLRQASERSVVTDPGLSIREGALGVTRSTGGALLFPKVEFAFLERVGEAHGFDLDTPWRELSQGARRVILHGSGEDRFPDRSAWSGRRSSGNVTWQRRYKGVLPSLEGARAKGSRRKMVERFLAVETCPGCDGARITPAARAVRLGGTRLPELTRLPVERLPDALADLALTPREQRIGADLLREISRRLEFLLEVGLGYLTLDRAADTLSGGEAQRIRLAAQLGAGLQGVLYVLDEPSIGLHSRDHERLLGALKRLRDLGNSVVVVEHDEGTLRAADWIVDIGPGAGRHGGRLIAEGPPAEVARADGPTARLLRGESVVGERSTRREGDGRWLRLQGAAAHNLQGVDLEIPLGTLTVVSGVSGSGKSTLVQRTLRPALERGLGREVSDPGTYDRLEGREYVEDLVVVDASPIGRTPRSNPATYIKVLSPIRDLFAALPEARMRGYTKSHFSFNVEGGRCEACGGAGATQVELQFLAPVTVPCDECGGKRFQDQVLDVRYKGHSIADVLALPAEDALVLFEGHPLITRPLQLMCEVGLGYLTLGQPSTTISGGEAQRLKLVSHLSKRPRGHVLYLLDEPSTGLHHEDVGRLEAALQRLVELGHTVVVIEHNLELIGAADHVVDLGPEGGAAGGRVIAVGTPEDIEACGESYTGEALRELRAKRRAPRRRKGPIGKEGASGSNLRVEGARTHNLCSVDVEIPRGSLAVVTGPSGSGKSSLALDTIHAEGRRRFVESLSTYARQFLGLRDRPPVDRIEGLGPSVAVEARVGGSQPRSTVATTTELHDQLRVLYARAGTPRCPEHGEALKASDAAGIGRRVLKAVGDEGARGWVLAPLAGSLPEESSERAEALDRLRTEWLAAGFARVLADGVEIRLEEGVGGLEDAAELDLVVDRLKFTSSERSRLAEAVEQASAVARGRVSILVKGGERLEYSTRGACTQCGFQLEGALEPRHFSFNTVVGACPDCHGLGSRWTCDADLLVADPEKPLREGGLTDPFGRFLVKGKGYHEHLFRTVCASHRIDPERPLAEMSEGHRNLVLFGRGARKEYRVEIQKSWSTAEIEQNFRAEWRGLCGQVDRWHQKSEDSGWRETLETVMAEKECPTCSGERLAPGPRAVTVGRLRLPELLAKDVDAAHAAVEKLRIPGAAAEVAEPIRAELLSRLGMLRQVGLGYLTLDRATSTLSGGEARRVRLSASLGSELVGVLYVLDEPTVGLHPADVEHLIGALELLRDRGNTLLVVEHDDALMRRADWIVDMGPGAGTQGGRVVATGTPDEVARHATSGTALQLRGELDLGQAADEISDEPHGLAPAGALRLRGAKLHNLRGVDLDVRFGELLGLCGPSGSGKSSLALGCLAPALAGERPEGRWKGLSGAAGAGVRTVVVDASPIGRTPHSVPATYSGLMPALRDLFARTPDARRLGFVPGHFSFNSNKGRCPACEGRGSTKVEMQFLADLWLTCDECDGQRFRPEVLEVRWRGLSIADVLSQTVDQAAAHFAHQPDAARILESLQAVGLGYLGLGQSATTLSGGEAQRLKLAAELHRARQGVRSVLILDEPSTGLAGSDLVHLARTLRRLALRGNAVVVIEHQTDLLNICDRLVELGPAGGAEGGKLHAQGTPAELAANSKSITGPFLAPKGAISKPRRARKKVRKARGAKA